MIYFLVPASLNMFGTFGRMEMSSLAEIKVRQKNSDDFSDQVALLVGVKATALQQAPQQRPSLKQCTYTLLNIMYAKE